MPHKGIIELVEALPAIREVVQIFVIGQRALFGERFSQCWKSWDRSPGLSARHARLDFLPGNCAIKLAEVVVFPYRDSNESSSAAVRMAISGRCNIAITPVDVFSDIAAGCFVLPGQESSDLAEACLIY